MSFAAANDGGIRSSYFAASYVKAEKISATYSALAGKLLPYLIYLLLGSLLGGVPALGAHLVVDSTLHAKRLIQRGVNVLLISAYKFLDVARKAYMTGDTAAMDDLMSADVLMIDDMGAEPLMENITIVQWFNLINERQLRGKGTIISTNLMEDELRRHYTERIASRLLGGSQCRLIQFAGDDVRRRNA